MTATACRYCRTYCPRCHARETAEMVEAWANQNERKLARYLSQDTPPAYRVDPYPGAR